MAIVATLLASGPQKHGVGFLATSLVHRLLQQIVAAVTATRFL